jgi:membrane fusion protein, peptide pheromone/bacteriocin exporter
VLIMKGYIRELHELTDSREMMEAKPHRFVSIFIYLLLLIIVSLILWSYFGEIDTVAKANAIVRPNEKTSSIQTSVQARVKEVMYTQGDSVKSGDVLLILDADELSTQKQAINQKLSEVEQEIADLKKFKESVEKQQNLFTEENKKFYEAYKQFELDYKKIKDELQQVNLQLEKSKEDTEYSKNQLLEKEKSLQSSKKEFVLTIESLEKEKEQLSETLSNLQDLEKSYLDKKNYMVDQTSHYYNQYIEFENSINQLEKSIEEKRLDYENAKKLDDQGEEIDVNQYKEIYEASKLELNNFINSKLISVRSEISTYEQKLEAIKLELKKLKETNQIEIQQQQIESEKNYLKEKLNSLQDELSHNEKLQEITLEKFKTDKLVEINNNIEQQEEIMKDLKAQLDAINIQLNNYKITSPIDGIIHVNKVVNKGDIIHPGETIITIIPTNQQQYKMVLSVLNKDISKMKVGDTVKYHFIALPYREYGALEGKITKISTDAIVNPESGLSYYTVEATLQNKSLYSYKGNEAEIKVGMQAEALVVSESKKILHFVLEKINLID